MGTTKEKKAKKNRSARVTGDHDDEDDTYIPLISPTYASILFRSSMDLGSRRKTKAYPRLTSWCLFVCIMKKEGFINVCVWKCTM